MAELASGAVSSLLGVIRNEQQLLSGVRGDVQFIKEEMESMSSFLLHLARTAPPGGEHDEQIRTWMNQVRFLAQDCNNCIDLYLYRGNADFHLARSGLRRYLWWAPWFLQRMIAQHRAAFQLRALKDRARDVGERRLRYGVEVPAKAGRSPSRTATTSATAGGGEGAGGDDDDQQDDDDHQLVVATAPTDPSVRRRAAVFELPTLDDFFEEKLVQWFKTWPGEATKPPSVAVVAPDSSAAAREASAVAKNFEHSVLVVEVDMPAVHLFEYYAPRTKDTLYYILRKLKLKPELAASQSPQQQQEGGAHAGQWREGWLRKVYIYLDRRELMSKIKRHMIQKKEFDLKIGSIKSELQQVKVDKLLQHLTKMKDKDKLQGTMDKETLGSLLMLLTITKQAADEQFQGRKKSMPTSEAWYNTVIEETAMKLKMHIEEEVTANKLKELAMEEENEGREEATNKLQVPPTEDEKEGKEEATKKLQEPAMEEGKEGKEEATNKLKEPAMEEEIKGAKSQSPRIHLDDDQYKRVLREVFSKTSNSKPLQAHEQDTKQQATKTPAGASTTVVEDQIKEMIYKFTEILQELKEDKFDKKQETDKPDDRQDQIDKAMEKIDDIKQKIQEQLKIKGIVDKIKEVLKDVSKDDEKILIILNVDRQKIEGSIWEDTRYALSLLGCRVALIATTTTSTRQAKEYFYPPCEPIDYSLVGHYYDIVLKHTSQQKSEDSHDPQIFRAILEECEPHEFCMRIFAHALYAKPKRSKEELCKLQSTLTKVSPKSFGSIAKKMLKFSYNDLPKEYKSCLLYLAIFPPGHKIRRSTLIGRWVVEGLITTDDWRWSSSVRTANRCFDELIDRWLVYPTTDIGATGEVKNCMVGDQVHAFITKIAKKQHIVETRLSNHLARHFSISNDLRLRPSDKIENFFQKLSKLSQFPLLKVLDLEGCWCFGGKNKRNLKDICCKIKLLKYLSLRRTDVKRLPSEINNLHELEVLDIRETKVPPSATRNLRLLKLKRLLAGHTDTSPSSTDISTAVNVKKFFSVEIPEKVENMEGMEVLSRVKPRSKQDLKDIGRLWQLRKLRVVIDDRKSHLKSLLGAISNLHECLRSLSITLLPTGSGGSPDITESWLEHTPKVLESLSISGSGTIQKVLVQLLQLLANENNQLTKVTLSNTLLSQTDLKILAKLPKLQCVRLRHEAYNESKLTFTEGDFQKLKYFLVEGSKIIDIIFNNGATVELETIVLPLNDSLKLSGVDELPRLKELELNNSSNHNNNTKTNNNSNTNNSGTITAATTNTNPSAATITTTNTTPSTDTTTKTTPSAASTNNNTTPAAVALNTNTNPATTATTTTNTTPSTATTSNTTPVCTTPVAATMTANTTPSAAATSNTTPAIVDPNTNTSPATTNTIPANTTPVTTANTTNNTPSTAATTTDNTPSTATATTTNTMLLSLLENAKRIAKVTLRGTMLKQGDLQFLAKMPNNIRCLVLLDKSYDGSQLTFNKDDFPKLNLLIVECSDITKISFTTGSSPKLEKFTWTFTNMESLSGISDLPRLKELEFKGEFVPNEVKEDIKKHKNTLYITHYKPENKGQGEGSPVQKSGVAKFSWLLKDKGWHQRRN